MLIYFFINNFFDILRENPIAIKWITPPMIADVSILSVIIQEITNPVNDGTVRIRAIIVPLRNISRLDKKLDFLSSDNSEN